MLSTTNERTLLLEPAEMFKREDQAEKLKLFTVDIELKRAGTKGLHCPSIRVSSSELNEKSLILIA